MIDDYGLIEDRAPHLVADLCEIIAFFENREVSRGDIEGFLYEKGAKGLLDDLDLENLDSASANAKFQKLSEDVFRHLTYRTKAIGEWYPFIVEADILVPIDAPTERHKVYAALVAFSRLKMFDQARVTQFAADFEVLCYEAAVAFAIDWKVIHFGVGGRDRAHYGNKLKESLSVLATTLREDTNAKALAKISENNTGDAGIDIIVYRDWDDPAQGMPSYFGQCAAQQLGWPKKKFEASALNLERYFSFFHKPGTLMFIPVCYRGLDGHWLDYDGHQTIIVDRNRIIELLETRIGLAQDEEAVLNLVPKPFELGCAVV
ncbi:hypothetical protein [Sulfitobacter sp. 1A12157]|jgi:hypothetical protein|uniref:hypothetical protein n=1 Tax=Sulfitobacter sp. 1A12157 TaxID=3368594 RepID=UPI0037475EF2